MTGTFCSTYSQQAAEYFLRAETGITELDAFQLVGTERADGGAAHTLFLAEDSLQALASCGDMEMSVFSRYRLVTQAAQP